MSAAEGAQGLRGLLRRLLSPRMRAWAVAQQRKHNLVWPRRGTVSFGDLRRVTPVSAIFGLDRGRPIDRYYIERFLEAHASDVRGRALELGDATYIERFGRGRVTRTDVLHVVAGNPQATIVADLADAPHVATDSFDCIIFTQSLQMIYDMRSTLATLHRILKPGGVLLLTSAGIARIGRRLGRDDWGEYWRITAQSADALLHEAFPRGDVRVQTYGNVLAAVAFLHGLAPDELEPAELDYVDPDYEVIVAARARKSAA